MAVQHSFNKVTQVHTASSSKTSINTQTVTHENTWFQSTHQHPTLCAKGSTWDNNIKKRVNQKWVTTTDVKK